MGSAVTITPDPAPVTITPDAGPPVTQSFNGERPLTSYGQATLSGLESVGRGVKGAAKGVFDMVAAPPADDAEKSIALLGPAALPLYRTIKGLGHTAADATQIVGAVHDINQSADPLGSYAKAAQETAGEGAGQAVTALATEGVARGVPALKEAIPSTARAGAALQDIKATVGDIPIDVSKVGDSALELYTQSQRGATLPPAVNKLVRRLTQPDSEPMTYAEAKDFQSNISNLSANEKMNLKPNQVRLVGQLNADLKASLEDAADTAGKGDQFVSAMKEYHNAMRLKGWSEAAIKNAWKVALGALGVREAAKIVGVGQ